MRNRCFPTKEKIQKILKMFENVRNKGDRECNFLKPATVCDTVSF